MLYFEYCGARAGWPQDPHTSYLLCPRHTADRVGVVLKKLEQMGMEGFDRIDDYWDGHRALSVTEAQYYLRNLECGATVSRWWCHHGEAGNGSKKRKAG